MGKGPPRPADLSSALIYSIQLSSWQPPHFGLTVQCVAPIVKEDGNQQVFLLDIVQEIGARLRTVALVHKLRCVSVGPWSTKQALLRKHWTLEHLLGGIGESEVLVKSVEGGEEGGGVCQTIAICRGGEKDWRIYRGATICG